MRAARRRSASGRRSGRQSPLPKIVGDKPRGFIGNQADPVANLVDPVSDRRQRDKAVMFFDELVVIRYSPA